MTEGIELHGFDEMIRALQNAPEIAKPVIERAMVNACDIVIGRLKDEPPATDANRPGRWREVKNPSGSVSLRPEGFYERHAGYWYPVMKHATLGEGKALKSEGRMTARRARGLYGLAGKGGVAGYKLSKKRSEFLAQSWAREIRWDATAVLGVLKNNASYASRVEGVKGEQSPIMARIGWPRLDTALAESTPDIIEIFGQARDDLLGAIAQRAGRNL